MLILLSTPPIGHKSGPEKKILSNNLEVNFTGSLMENEFASINHALVSNLSRCENIRINYVHFLCP